jgi:hypothetical protein
MNGEVASRIHLGGFNAYHCPAGAIATQCSMTCLMTRPRCLLRRTTLASPRRGVPAGNLGLNRGRPIQHRVRARRLSRPAWVEARSVPGKRITRTG